MDVLFNRGPTQLVTLARKWIFEEVLYIFTPHCARFFHFAAADDVYINTHKLPCNLKRDAGKSDIFWLAIALERLTPASDISARHQSREQWRFCHLRPYANSRR